MQTLTVMSDVPAVSTATLLLGLTVLICDMSFLPVVSTQLSLPHRVSVTLAASRIGGHFYKNLRRPERLGYTREPGGWRALVMLAELERGGFRNETSVFFGVAAFKVG